MLNINKSYQSVHYRSRKGKTPQFIKIGSTCYPFNASLGILIGDDQLAKKDLHYFTNILVDGSLIDLQKLCQQKVGVHYLISETGEIYQLIDELFAVCPKELSAWNVENDANDYSICIELVNIGQNWLKVFPKEREFNVKVNGINRVYCNYTPEQIEVTIELCQLIVQKYSIHPYNIVGYSDIAWYRDAKYIREDPGPAFPWQLFAKKGITMWYDLSESTMHSLPDDPDAEAKKMLAEFGYKIYFPDINNKQFKALVQAFKTHFKLTVDGDVDLNFLQVINSLCQQKRQYQAFIKRKAKDEEAAYKLEGRTSFTPGFNFLSLNDDLKKLTQPEAVNATDNTSFIELSNSTAKAIEDKVVPNNPKFTKV